MIGKVFVVFIKKSHHNTTINVQYEYSNMNIAVLQLDGCIEISSYFIFFINEIWGCSNCDISTLSSKRRIV